MGTSSLGFLRLRFEVGISGIKNAEGILALGFTGRGRGLWHFKQEMLVSTRA